MKVIFIGGDDETADLAQMSVRIRWPEAASLVAATAQEGIEAAGEFSPDVVLLNPPFPDMSLSKAIQGVRRFSHVPLMVLDRGGNPMEGVTALEMGADAYVRLPCELTEMMARVSALLRRFVGKTYHEGERPVRSGELFINPATYEVFMGSREVMLTSTEFRLLFLLVKNRSSVVSHETLERTLWGENSDSSRLVKKYVQRLRQKLGDTAQDPIWITSLHGVGYRFVGPKPEFLEIGEPAIPLAG